MNDEKLVKFENVYFDYEYGENVIKNLNIEIYEGDFIGIKGFNGAGKTTFIKLLLNIIKPNSGEIFFSKKILDGQIGYVRQNIDTSFVNFPASVREIVMLGLYPKIKKFRFFNKMYEEKAIKTLEKVGMEDFSNKKISDLSGGQRQKVMIAKALSFSPSFLVLDEPDSGIDEKSVNVIFKFLRDLNKKEKLTIVVISHNIEILEKYTDRLYLLKNGKLN